MLVLAEIRRVEGNYGTLPAPPLMGADPSMGAQGELARMFFSFRRAALCPATFESFDSAFFTVKKLLSAGIRLMEENTCWQKLCWLLKVSAN